MALCLLQALSWDLFCVYLPLRVLVPYLFCLLWKTKMVHMLVTILPTWHSTA